MPSREDAECILERLLSESQECAIRRAATAFDVAVGRESDRFIGSPPLVLFGAGRLGRRTLAGLRAAGVEPLCFVDSRAGTTGRADGASAAAIAPQVDGLAVLSPEEGAARYGRSAVFVITIWNCEALDTMADRQRQLARLGCERIVPFGLLYWKYPAALLPYYPVDLPHRALAEAPAIRSAFELWSDSASRDEYVRQVAWRLGMDFGLLKRPSPSEQYFPEDLVIPQPEEVLADCGAFRGDTLVRFVRGRGMAFRRVVAFEPDRASAAYLRTCVAALPQAVRERVSLRECAVGARRGTVRFEETGTVRSRVGGGGREVECVLLDDEFAGEPPTYVKMDVEGSELDALAGARRIVREHAPVLAVSAYHLQNHLWQVPLLIRSLNDGYRFYLRQHGAEGWELVCYAVPPDRAVR